MFSCGKSTQVPQFILQDCPDGRILVAQPRRLAAISLAKRVAMERGETLGESIGYRVSRKQVGPGYKCTFVTFGLLLQMLVHNREQLVKTFTHIVIDEAHERELDLDMIMLIFKRMLVMNEESHDMAISVTSRPRLIVMSATFNSELFSNYFAHFAFNAESHTGIPPPAPILSVGNRLFPVKSVFLDELCKNFSTDFPCTSSSSFGGVKRLDATLYKQVAYIISKVRNKSNWRNILSLLLNLWHSLHFWGGGQSPLSYPFY